MTIDSYPEFSVSNQNWNVLIIGFEYFMIVHTVITGIPAAMALCCFDASSYSHVSRFDLFYLIGYMLTCKLFVWDRTCFFA